MTQQHKLLFSPYTLGNISLANRMVMAPMTRSRATDNIPNELMAEYYGQRAGAGLIVTEGTSPSANGLGYARIPGMYSNAQIEGWKKTTDAVHEKGSKIFVQLMHTGRITHPLNLPAGAKVVAPSAIAAANTQMYTDAEGMKPLPVPEAIAEGDIAATIKEFADSAKAAIAAGFDGVELHGANGYLLEQFLNEAANQRTDNYGGSIENRNRFVLETAAAVAEAIGKEKTGIRLSPFGAFNEIVWGDTTEEQFVQLAKGLKEIGIVYIHLVDHSSMGAPALPQTIKDVIRKTFGSTIIVSGGLNADTAEAAWKPVKVNWLHLAGHFLQIPIWKNAIAKGHSLNEPHMDTFYTPGEKGYTDYPVFKEEEVSA